jgi:transposase
MASQNSISFDLPGFVIDAVEEHPELVVIQAHSTANEGMCPDCSQMTSRVHSYYTRSPRDLSSSGRKVRLVLNVHRFRCPNSQCPRRTFAERIPQIAPVHGQRTGRLTAILAAMALEVSAEVGARISRHLNTAVSGDTLRRLARATDMAPSSTPRVLGIDDWAFKKGHRYGTILVDLERHEVVDLLPDREVNTLVAWLRDHPGAEIICRDRASDYAKAATEGAPQATQIADRWHLLKNLGEALQRLLNQHRSTLRQAAKQVQAETVSAIPMIIQPNEPVSTAASSDRSPTAARRQQWYDDVRQLAAQGYSKRAIARQMNINRATVERYLAADQVPAHHSSPVSTVAAYDDHLRKRIAEDGYSIRAVWQELQAQGFTGSYASVQRAVHRLTGKKDRRKCRTQDIPISRPLSPRQAMWLLVRDPDQLTPDQVRYREILCELSPEISEAYGLAQWFVALFKQRHVEELDCWLHDTQHCGIPALQQFALGLQRDYAAVHASLLFDWSSGQVEGQVNRLKVIKRMMYGRAKFDLLRLYVLHPP